MAASAQRLGLLLAGLLLLNRSAWAQNAGMDARQGALPGKYGYFEVREGAHTFWWSFPYQGAGKPAGGVPLILWLQGGPGASGVGFGNFEEIGPYQRGWRPRKHSWAQLADLLFVDSPVGTGFSYVTSNASYATDNAQIAADLTSFLRQWLQEHSAQDQPLYIFCESYGGKMAAGLAERLLAEQRAGRLKANLRGVALGDSWISPLDFVLTWPAFLKAWSLLSDGQLSRLTPLLLQTQAALSAGNNTGATALWGAVEERIGNLTDNVDWYNALLHNIPDTEASGLEAQPTAAAAAAAGWAASQAAGLTGADAGLAAGLRLLARHHSDPLIDFMRKEVTPALGSAVPANVSWGAQAGGVFAHLAGDFMLDSISSVDALLDAGLPVTIYSGQLDLICSTLGLDAWLPRLAWPHLPAFQAAQPQPLYALGRRGRETTGFVRRERNLQLFVMLNAGHMVPADQPVAALDMVARILAWQPQTEAAAAAA